MTGFEFVEKMSIREIMDDDTIKIPEMNHTFPKDLLIRSGPFKETFPNIKKAGDAAFKGKKK